MPRRPRTLVAFIVSYLAILAIPVALGAVVYVEAVSIAERDAQDYNLAMLRQAQLVVDARVRAVNQTAYQIAGQGKVVELMSAESPLTLSDRLRAFSLVAELGAYSSLESFVDDLYIYFFRSDVIVTPTSLYDAQLFYDSVPRSGPTTIAEWKGELTSRRYFRAYDRARVGAPRTHGDNPIACITSMPLRYGSPPEAVLVLLMDASRITGVLDAVASVNHGAVQVIDEHDNLIATTDASAPVVVSYGDLAGSEGFARRRSAAGRLVVSYRASTEVPWKYVSVVSERALLARVRTIRAVAARVVLACLVLGLVAALLLSYRTYRPIRRLVSLVVGDSGGADAEARGNELDLVARRFSQMAEERRRLERRYVRIRGVWKSQRETLVNTLLYQLLIGRKDDAADVAEALRGNGVSLGDGACCVVVFRRSGGGRSGRAGGGNRAAEPAPLAEELRPAVVRPGDLLVATGPDSAALIVVGTAAGLQQEAQARAAAVVPASGERLAAGVGGVHPGVEGVHRCYREALAALDYRVVKGAGVLAYRPAPGGEHYQYSIETEARIVAAARAGDAQLARSLVEEVLDANLGGGGLSLELLRCLMLDLIATAAKIAEVLSVPESELAVAGPLAELESLAEFRGRLLQVIEELCGRARSGQRSHNEQLKAALLRYIEENYANRDLSVASMARAFAISPSYLSHFFKEQTGVNALERVNRRRIERAKELLADRRLTISAVAQEVGYSGDLALTRFFKRFEGRTPGRYRDGLLGAAAGRRI